MKISILRLALKSLYNRRLTALLTLMTICISVMLFLGVEKVRRDARLSFTNTISGTDLIVGARSGSIQLLLYSVFRIGNATNNIRWRSYLDISSHKAVKWAIPISLGDSHKGFRVMGTSADYFEHFRYARSRSLAFSSGRPFKGIFEAVIGAGVARELGYAEGEAIVLAHGAGEVSFIEHADKPFRVVGILEPTSTPVDRTVHVSLEGIEAIHIDWQDGAPTGRRTGIEATLAADLTPKSITAFMMGLNSKMQIFGLQRKINEYEAEGLLAILPGVALSELWDLMAVAENALLIISAFVVFAGLCGMVAVILSSLAERRREMAILRAVGARPIHIFGLMLVEAGAYAFAGVSLGTILLYGVLIVVQPLVAQWYGIHIAIEWLQGRDLALLAIIVLVSLVVGLLPALKAYRQSLADGLVVRI